MAEQRLQAPGDDDEQRGCQQDFEDGGQRLAHAQGANGEAQQHEQDDGVQRVLHGVGKGQRGHADGLPEGQGDSQIAQQAHGIYGDGDDGVLARVEGGDEQLVDGHEGELVGVVLQGNGDQRGIGAAFIVVPEDEESDGFAQDDQTSGGRDHQQQAQAKAELQCGFEAVEVVGARVF